MPPVDHPGRPMTARAAQRAFALFGVDRHIRGVKSCLSVEGSIVHAVSASRFEARAFILSTTPNPLGPPPTAGDDRHCSRLVVFAADFQALPGSPGEMSNCRFLPSAPRCRSRRRCRTCTQPAPVHRACRIRPTSPALAPCWDWRRSQDSLLRMFELPGSSSRSARSCRGSAFPMISSERFGGQRGNRCRSGSPCRHPASAGRVSSRASPHPGRDRPTVGAQDSHCQPRLEAFRPVECRAARRRGPWTMPLTSTGTEDHRATGSKASATDDPAPRPTTSTCT